LPEDEPGYTCSFNLFYDPLKPLDPAGFTYPILFPMPFSSALKWAQNQDGWPAALGGNQSWKKASDSFCKGLRVLNQDERDKNLAGAFRALGQVMHLVQDMSVPAHVRNDMHDHMYLELPLGIAIGRSHYETWVRNHPKELQTYLERESIFDKSILNWSGPDSASILVSTSFHVGR
jgi:hypothetical protein